MTYPKVSTDPERTGARPLRRRASPRSRSGCWRTGRRTAPSRPSVDARDPGENGSNEFVFYDGPPFANGLPHYGHLLTGYVKDIVPRYETMRGRRVERRFGWDTHGLPAELEAQRQLGLKTKQDIVELGIEAFNAKCRESVLKYTGEWREYVTRQARWVDFDNDYKTMNPDFMESVIWAFKQLYDKGLVYEGFRVLPYCWNDQTPAVQPRAAHGRRRLPDPPGPGGHRRLPARDRRAGALIWTTTPWTLPSNLGSWPCTRTSTTSSSSPTSPARTDRYLLAEARLPAYARELGHGTRDVDERIVAAAQGQRPGRPHLHAAVHLLPGHASAHRVPAADFVTTEDGTGPGAHVAGAFGEDDKEVTDRGASSRSCRSGRTAGSPGRSPTTRACTSSTPTRTSSTTSRPPPTRSRRRPARSPTGTVLLRRETYDHAYPHCWRCREPLIYMAVSSWFVEVTRFKDRMVELNQQIDWTPEHVKDGQFGKWLENARDWSISRNRFWGSPIPVWKSDDPTYPRVDVYGSFEELERDFGGAVRRQGGRVRPAPAVRRPPDPAQPRRPDGAVDDAPRRGRAGRVVRLRLDELRPGALPVRERRLVRARHFPGDFIVEYIGQTRGWFYTLHILATAIFDRPAFETCLSHGIVLGSDGQKMSKSLRNYPDVREVFDRDGADAMRWFLMSRPILRGGNLVVTEQGIRDSVRQVLIPLWNSWYFFQLYANAASYDAQWSTASTDPLDRYLLAKCRQYVEAMTQQLDNYEVANACDSTRSFLDVLTNWYIRRSRERFWAADGVVDEGAFDTLYTVLEVVCRVTAPLMPLATEEVWRGLTGGRSVHLTDWPLVEDLPGDDALVAAMDQVRDVCSATSALRKAGNLRNRLPLSTLTVVVTDAAALEGFESIVADEVNVKTVRLLDADAPEAASYGVSQKLTVNARAAGPRLGRDVQTAIKGSKSGDWSHEPDGTVIAGGLVLEEGEYTLETVAGSADGGSATGMLPSGGFVVLDTAVTPELAAEGLARDLVRAVQQARRDAGLDVSDRIALTIGGSPAVQAAARTHESLIAGETLATSYEVKDGDAEGTPVTVGDNEKATVLVTRA